MDETASVPPGSTEHQSATNDALKPFSDERLLLAMEQAAWQHLVGKIQHVKSENLQEEARQFLQGDTALKERLETSVYRRMHTALSDVARTLGAVSAECRAHGFLLTHQHQWVAKVQANLESLVSEVAGKGLVPDRRHRGRAEARWKNLGAAKHLAGLKAQGYHAVLTRKELLEFIAGVQDESFMAAAGTRRNRSWRKFLTDRMSLPVASLFNMKTLFKVFACAGSGDEGAWWFIPHCADTLYGRDEQQEAERNALAQRALSSEQAVVCRQMTKLVCPVPHRARLWRATLLGGDLGCKDPYVASLVACYYEKGLVLDGVVQLDVHNAPANSDDFFVLEDQIHAVMLLLLRDEWVRKHSAWSLADCTRQRGGTAHDPEAPASLTTAEGGNSLSSMLPPCGVIPGEEFSYLAAPVCFIFAGLDDIYPVFRQLYVRYFCHLTAPCSAHRFGLLSLLFQLEALLQQRAPRVFEHLVAIDASMAAVALPWFTTAFAAILPTEQVLVVWDFLIGYDTTEVLPVVAAALFFFRSATLLTAKSVRDVEMIMSDFRSVSVTCALKHFFSGARAP